MTKKLIQLGIFIIVLGAISCNSIRLPKGGGEKISHEKWDSLLKDYVSDQGAVNYKGFVKDSNRLNEYLQILSNNPPNTKSWTREEQLAYWINAYNAFTVKLIVKYYPLKSIKDIKGGIVYVNTVWDMDFFSIGGQKFNLNNIEHGIIRKHWSEPKIHFAVNCASISCPQLRNEAYVGEKIYDQLTEQAQEFLADESKNKLAETPPKISPIFKWFKKDFTKSGSLITFLNQYAPKNIPPNTELEYTGYDWALNEAE